MAGNDNFDFCVLLSNYTFIEPFLFPLTSVEAVKDVQEAAVKSKPRISRKALTGHITSSTK